MHNIQELCVCLCTELCVCLYVRLCACVCVCVCVTGQLTALKILRLSHNRLSTLPAELGLLTQLEVLAVDSNTLSAIPGGYCTVLQTVHCL